MNFEDIACKAEVACGALTDLAEATAKVPNLKLNFSRSIELLHDLAKQSRACEASAEKYNVEALPRALTPSLQVVVDKLTALKLQVAPAVQVARKRALVNEILVETGRQGGLKQTAAQKAAAMKNLATIAKRRTEKRQAKETARSAALSTTVEIAAAKPAPVSDGECLV